MARPNIVDLGSFDPADLTTAPLELSEVAYMGHLLWPYVDIFLAATDSPAKSLTTPPIIPISEFASATNGVNDLIG